jgi:hypothetical protein
VDKEHVFVHLDKVKDGHDISAAVLLVTDVTAIGRWAYQAKKEEEEKIDVVLFVNEN